MPLLNGYTRTGYAGAPQSTPPIAPSAGGGATIVIDGTPVRVVMLALAAAAGLAALKWAGFRFNVGV